MSDFLPPPPPGSTPPPPPPGAFGGPPPGYAAYGAPAGPTAELASIGSRIGAKLIDALILGGASIAALAPAGIALAAGPTRITTCSVDEDGVITIGEEINAICEVPTGGTWAAAGVLALVGLAAIIWLYVYYFRREGHTGQTWGRKAASIRLVDATTGGPIGPGRSFGRYLFASFISGNVCLLGYLWALWDPRKQTWHDKVVTSVVVKA